MVGAMCKRFLFGQVQGKWLACLLAGRCALPPKEEMEREIKAWEASVSGICYQPLLIDGVPYIKTIKREIRRAQQRASRLREERREESRTKG